MGAKKVPRELCCCKLPSRAVAPPGKPIRRPIESGKKPHTHTANRACCTQVQTTKPHAARIWVHEPYYCTPTCQHACGAYPGSSGHGYSSNMYSSTKDAAMLRGGDDFVQTCMSSNVDTRANWPPMYSPSVCSLPSP
jgi:hypothetical protein